MPFAEGNKNFLDKLCSQVYSNALYGSNKTIKKRNSNWHAATQFLANLVSKTFIPASNIVTSYSGIKKIRIPLPRGTTPLFPPWGLFFVVMAVFPRALHFAAEVVVNFTHFQKKNKKKEKRNRRVKLPRSKGLRPGSRSQTGLGQELESNCGKNKLWSVFARNALINIALFRLIITSGSATSSCRCAISIPRECDPADCVSSGWRGLREEFWAASKSSTPKTITQQTDALDRKGANLISSNQMKIDIRPKNVRGRFSPKTKLPHYRGRVVVLVMVAAVPASVPAPDTYRRLVR